MVKLIVTDIDGTLVPNSTPYIPEPYFDEIRRLTDAGIVFVAASGRQENSVLNVFKPVLDRIYIISNNGSRLSKNGVPVYTKFIPRDIVESLTEELRAYNRSVATFDENGRRLIGPGTQGIDIMMATHDTQYYFPEASEYAVDVTTNNYKFNTQPFPGYDVVPDVSKICCFRNERYPHPAIAFGKKYPQLDTVVAGPDWVDFGPGGVSKGTAVEFLQKELGISREETIAFGDQENDTPMFRAAGCGYAVANASEVALAAADKVIDSMQEDGVLKVLRTL